jgi:hypothetical protein
MNLQEKFIFIYQELCSEKFLPNSGTSLALYFIFVIHQANSDMITLNKSAVISAAPHQLGSLTRRRHVLNFLIHSNAICVRPGRKKSEQIVRTSQRVKQILDCIDD